MVFSNEHVRIETGNLEGRDYAKLSISNPGYSNPNGHNVIDTEMLKDYAKALEELSRMGVEYTVTEWKGPTTGYGASIGEFAEMLANDNTDHFRQQFAAFLDRGIDIALKVGELKCYTISIMHGKGVYGGSVELPLPYNWTIGSDDLRLAFPEAGLCIVPGFGGLALLYERIGTENTEKLVSTAGQIDADTALSIGLVNQLSEHPFDTADVMIKNGEKPERDDVAYEFNDELIDLSRRRDEPPPLVLERIPVIMAEIEQAYKADGLEAAMKVNRDACVDLGSFGYFRDAVKSFLKK